MQQAILIALLILLGVKTLRLLLDYKLPLLQVVNMTMSICRLINVLSLLQLPQTLQAKRNSLSLQPLLVMLTLQLMLWQRSQVPCWISMTGTQTTLMRMQNRYLIFSGCYL